MRPSIYAQALAWPFEKRVSMWVGVAGIAVLYVGSTLPSALYPLYQREFGFSELMVTGIYASYVIGNVAVLLSLGRLSDQLGRRPTSVIAFATLLISTLCFLLADATGWLFAARVLSGVAAGLGAGALTAWIAELEPSGERGRAALVASAGNLAGLAFGPALAGILAQYAPWPLRTSYVLYLAMLLLMMTLLRALPEGVTRRVASLGELSLRPRIGVPRQIRARFISPAAMAFAMFALGGFYAALTPGVLARQLHATNLAVAGTVVGLFFGTGAAVAASTGRVGNRAAMLLSTLLLLTGLALLVLAEQQRSMTLLVLATVVAGAAMALGFRCSLGMVNEMAPAAQRAEVVSAYLLVCYCANSLPIIGVGLLSLAVKPPVAHLAFAVVLAVLGISACTVGLRTAR
jgi:MFS family permease